MISLTPTEKNIYLNIRAEQIKQRQDQENGHLFKNPYSIETALALAQSQLDNDIEAGELRISLEDLLLLNNETCMHIADQALINRAKKAKQKVA